MFKLVQKDSLVRIKIMRTPSYTTRLLPETLVKLTGETGQMGGT